MTLSKVGKEIMLCSPGICMFSWGVNHGNFILTAGERVYCEDVLCSLGCEATNGCIPSGRIYSLYQEDNLELGSVL